MSEEIPAWLLAVKGVPLPGLQPVVDDVDVALPPSIKFSGVAYPDPATTNGTHRMYLITVELPGGNHPRWALTVGHIRLHDAGSYDLLMDQIVPAVPGFQLLGPKVSKGFIDWSESEQSAYEAFYYYTLQLHAVMQKAMYFAGRLARSEPGTQLEEIWEFADPADYYEFYLLMSHANCLRHGKHPDRKRDLEAHRQWWTRLMGRYEGITTPVISHWRAIASRHDQILMDLRRAQPSF